MTRTPHGLALALLMTVGMFMFGTATFFIAGPILETNYYPVLTDMDVAEVNPIEPGSARFAVSGRKTRACEYIATVALVQYPDKHWEPAFVETDQQRKGVRITRPLGQQNMGFWTVIPGDGHPIKVEVHHRCHPLWTTVNDLGIWKQ